MNEELPEDERPTTRDLDALAWSLDLEQDIDEAILPSFVDYDRGRRA
jgi:hypothetical protein